jgi:hypothetical protein
MLSYERGRLIRKKERERETGEKSSSLLYCGLSLFSVLRPAVNVSAERRPSRAGNCKKRRKKKREERESRDIDERKVMIEHVRTVL